MRKVIAQEPSLYSNRNKKEIIRLKIYATFPTVMFEPSYAFFFGEKLPQKVRIACTYVSFITPLFDDYFENDQVQLLTQIISNKDTPQANQDVLIKRLYLRLKALTSNHKQLVKDIDDSFQEQIKADLQKQNEQISLIDLEKITREKSVIGFNLIMNLTGKEISPALQKVIGQLAFLLQLGDDIFDVWFDISEKSQTIATNAENAEWLKRFYLQEIEKLKQYVCEFCADKKKAKEFLKYYYFIISRVLVALNQYTNFDFERVRNDFQNNRKILVCDMEKWNNIFEWTKHYGLLKKQLN